ncbi:NYN domain-containing protein [Nocardia sp. NPDC052278]|uniref:NYN domain-containing protein n=1 Tax=unclassified Nocardia TaxID=2637762 RepID=UPI0036ADE101
MNRSMLRRRTTPKTDTPIAAFARSVTAAQRWIRPLLPAVQHRRDDAAPRWDGSGWDTARTGKPRVAVLIDADNVPAARIGAVLARAQEFGGHQIRRAYGDWRRPHLAGWHTPLLAHAIRPVQQFSWTTGKNASDLAMAIDAMELLFNGIRVFVLASSDSDFTGLALRLRESGCDVYGFGERKTPASFVSPARVMGSDAVNVITSRVAGFPR